MALESATYIHQLVSTNPTGSDPIAAGDDHLRLIKSALKATFPSLTGPVTVNQDTLNGITTLSGRVDAIENGVANSGDSVTVVSSLPADAPDGTVVFNTADNKLYQRVNGVWTEIVVQVNATQQVADASITVAKFAQGIRPVEIVDTLPTSGNVQGRLVFLTSDNKLYRYNGTAFTSSMPFGDLTGTVAANQIAANTITTGMIQAGAIGASQIAAGAISTAKLAAGAVTTYNLTAGAVTSDIIAAGSITSDKLAANSVTAGKIAAGIITVDKLSYASTLTGNGILFSLGSNANPLGYDSVGLFKNTSGTYDRGAVFGASAKSNVIPATAGASVDVGGFGGGFYNFATDGYTKISQFVGGHSYYAALAQHLNYGKQITFANANYAAYSNTGQGKIYAVDGMSPFTGAHDGITNETSMEIGDIMVDHEILQHESISSVVASYKRATEANQRGVIGVLSQVFNTPPIGWVPETPLDLAGGSLPPVENPTVPSGYKVVHVNALGEGLINVCGQNGNIERGDLIVSSDIPGKGMKQSDEVIRCYTVAKARESVTFSSPSEVKQIACVYLAG